MGLSEGLGNVYVKLEDAYYGALDFFEQRGIGVPWAYNDFLESKGIPALPVTLALLVLLVGGVGFVLATPSTQTVTFTLSLTDDKGEPLQDASIVILDEAGNTIRTLTGSDGQTITLEDIQPNSILTVRVSKQGYSGSEEILLSEDTKLSISLTGSNEAGIGRLQIVDKETQTPIEGALVNATWSGGDYPVTAATDDEGIAYLNVPLNKEISLTVKADNYEDLVDFIRFTGVDVKTKQLAPKAEASSGPSIVFVKAVDAKSKIVLEDVHIVIEDAKTGALITDVQATDGQHSETLNKGQVIRVRVEKEGYVSFSTNENFPGGITLRNAEENVIASLTEGGIVLFVSAKNKTNTNPLQNVEFLLLDEQNQKLATQKTNFSGDVEFPGLNQTKGYWILAFSPNYFPERVNVDWASLPESDGKKSLSVLLAPITTEQSGTVVIFATESNGKAANGATITLWERGEDDQLYPYVYEQQTDAGGSFTLRLPIGKTVLVEAEKNGVSDSEELTVAAGLNKLTLTLNGGLSEVELTLQNKDGSVFQGNLTVESQGGQSLFSGVIQNGKALVGVFENKVIKVRTIDTKGNAFEQTLTLDGSGKATIVVGEAAVSGEAPIVNFIGFLDAAGNPLPGLAPEGEGFARFEIKWPSGGSKGIFYVRAGNDATGNVDSQYLGITGLNGNGQAVYGKTYSPTPAPGNEPKDRQFRGVAGEFNKWVEVSLPAPSGTSIMDIRLSARKGIPVGTQELRYRASVETANGVQRTPADSVLGTASFVANKSGLYAETRVQMIPVYAHTPLCTGNLCVTAFFVDADGREYSIGNFSASKDKPYALQVEILPSTQVPATGNLVPTTTTAATLRVNTTPVDPLLFFTKGEVNTFGKLTEQGNLETSLNVPLPGVSLTSPGKARAHFVTKDVGQTSISVQVVLGSESWSRDIPLTIVEPKILNVQFAPSVELNENLRFVVSSEEGNPISDAFIALYDAKGKVAVSVKGKNTQGNGESGVYDVPNRLSAGFYAVRVEANGYERFEDGVSIGIANPLQLSEKVTIAIPFGQTTAVQNVSVKNNTSLALSNITGEFTPFGNFPSSILLEVIPPVAIAGNGNGTVQVRATYTGEATQQPLSGTASLRVRAEALEGHPLFGTTQLQVNYNQPLDPSCLVFNKDKLSVTLMGESQPFGNLYSGQGGTFSVNPNASYYGSSNTPNANVYNAQGYNMYGYNAGGAYQNVEQKQVSVSVKNNCGEELNIIPSVVAPDGSIQVDGLKIAAVDSGLLLKNGEQKTVDIGITNDLFRTGFGGYGSVYGGFNYGGFGGGFSGGFGAGFGYPATPYQYAVNFRAAQLSTSLPLEINFWNRNAAVQAPSSVELTLIQKGSAKTSDLVVVPLTNIGSVPIYDVRGRLEGENIPGVSMKLEGIQGSTSSGYGGLLAPGQTMQPPLAIVGELAQASTSSGTRTLVISGVVEGRRMDLRTINVFVRTGSASCLQISALDTPILFASPEVSGTISKRITIRNECLEPVRVTQVSPSSVGTNLLSISPVAAGNEIIDKDGEAEYQILLTKNSVAKQTVSIQVSGVQILSQQSVQSNALPLDIRLGPGELAQGLSTNAVSIPVCGGGTMDIRFPVLAKKDECTQAYCDAEQMANFISKTMEQHISKAVQVMQSKSNNTTQFSSCSLTSGYCTFPQLGINHLTFDVYLQNDQVSEALMNYVMQGEKYPRLKSMQAQLNPGLQGENAEEVFVSRLGTGFGNQVYLPPFQGCGKYTITVMGGVEQAANQLQPDKISMGIRLVNYQKTAECQDVITNAANFLPRDGTLTATNSRNTLLGLVKSAPDAQTQGEWLAETLFGSADRYVTTTGSNHLDLRIGNLSESVVEISLDPNTKGDGPKRIITTVKRTQGQVPREVISEVGQILSSLGNNVNGCVTPDQQTWRIFSIKDVGAFSFEGCFLGDTQASGLVARPTPACCTLTAKSDIKSNVRYDLNPNGEDIQGLESLDLYETQETGGILAPTDKIAYGGEYELVFDDAEQAYVKDVLLCAQTDARIQQQANGLKVDSIATRTLDGTKAGPVNVELRVCTQSPDKVLVNVLKKGQGTFYGTVDWQDDASQRTIVQVANVLNNSQALGNFYLSYLGQEIKASDNPVYQEQFRQQENAALLKFGAACAAACGACYGVAALATFGTAASAAVLDCTLSCGIGVGAGYLTTNKDLADGTLLEGPASVASYPISTLGSGVEYAFGVESENEAGAQAAAAGTATSIIKNTFKPVTVSKVDKPSDLFKTSDYAFLSEIQGEVTAIEASNKDVLKAYNDAYAAAIKPGEAANNAVTVSPGGSATITAGKKTPKTTKISVGQAEAFAGSVEDYKALRAKAEEAFDAFIEANDGKPGFKTSSFSGTRDVVLRELDGLIADTTALQERMLSGKAVPYNESIVRNRLNTIGKGLTLFQENLSKIKVNPAFYKTERAKKIGNFSKGLICGGAGNVAGYVWYSDTLAQEIENKITLEAGSENVLDPVTQELVFIKGQTYSFQVVQDPVNPTGKIVTIDIVPPTTYVNPSAWVDCT